MKLALGTVQFGLAYGVSNQSGQVSQLEVESILQEAWRQGIDTLDTAVLYGDSESVLGAVGVEQFRIVSKLPGLPDDLDDASSISGWVQEQVESSLERLRVQQLDSLLLHRCDDLLGNRAESLYEALIAIQRHGLTGGIGVSVYSPQQASTISDRFSIQMVQAPGNLLDRRLESSGVLDQLHHANVDVHMRSLFLQGLLLDSAARKKEYFARWSPLWADYEHWLQEDSITGLQACLAYGNGLEAVSKMVVGVESREQLLEIVDAARCASIQLPEGLSSHDLDLIDPSTWSRAN